MVSIIIRTKNEEKYLRRLLNALFLQSYRDIEIIVVDSGSTDRSLEIITQYPKVKLIEIPEREFSYGYALNKGCEVAEGDYLTFLSAHAIPVNDKWLISLLSSFKNRDVGAVYGAQLSTPITKLFEERDLGRTFQQQEIINYNNFFFHNANAIIRKTIWEDYRFDEKLPGAEDMDWGKRIMNSGYKIAYNPNAKVYHFHQENFRQIYNRYKREAIAYKKITPEREEPFFVFLAKYFNNIFGDYYYFFRKYKKKNIITFLSIPIFRLAKSFGKYRGLNFNEKNED